MSEPIHGKKLADAILEKVADKVSKMKKTPGMAAILVGGDPASKLYVKLKERAAKQIGIYFELHEFKENASEKEILTTVRELNKRNDIHGILVQLPLPSHNEDKIIDAIKPEKDVDGFHQKNRDRLANGKPSLVPPVALAVMKLIEATHQPVAGKHAVIMSNNPIFAEPILKLMEEVGVSGHYMHPDAEALDATTRSADIIVIAIGREQFLEKDMVKPGAIVIDVGANKTPDGSVVGDAHADVRDHAAFISPVPGGVGPLTVAYLMNNVLRAVDMQPKTRAKKEAS